MLPVACSRASATSIAVPADTALSRPARDVEHLGCLRVGEARHAPQDQRVPVLHPHVPGDRPYLLPEAFYVALDPDPHLLASVLGFLSPERVEDPPIYEARAFLGQSPEGFGIAPEGAHDQPPISSGAHPRAPSVGTVRRRRVRVGRLSMPTPIR
jgi:hypothetical protein